MLLNIFQAHLYNGVLWERFLQKWKKNHYKLFQITPRTPSVKVTVQKILTWGFDVYVDNFHDLFPYKTLLLWLKLCLSE